MNIPFHKPCISKLEMDSVIDAMQSGWLTMGPKTVEFEFAFQSYINARHSISVNSATAALHLALNALGVKRGDEVIIPTNTFVSTAEAVAYSGAVPVLCDIEPTNHNININLIENLITKNTKAIIPVHFAGHPCEMDEILDIAHNNNLKVIEDAAHALPSTYKDKKIGLISDITCFSFYATKTITTGEGGMVCTENDDFAKKIKFQRLHGINGDAWKRYDSGNDWYYDIVDLGYKYNTTDIQSAMGIVQLQKIDEMKEERSKIALKYMDAFKGKIDFISEQPQRLSSWHLFVIKVENREQLHRQLKEKGINTSVHFIPMHKHSYYKNKYNYKDKDFPIANSIFNKSLSLPIYPGLTEIEIEYIINNILKFSQKLS
tara:strand:- start:2 stop:1126 length:1125 start_codon:yes stop_codon:yes gene_type:complete